MPAGGGDLGGAPGDRLAAHRREVGHRRRREGSGPGGGRDRGAAEDVRDRRREVRDGNGADAGDRRGLRRVRLRQDDLGEAAVARREREAERAPYRADLAAEAELPDEHARRLVRAAEAAQPQQADRDRQVERGAALPEVGGREVDGDRPLGHRESPVLQRGADAFAGFADARVGKTHDREAGQAEGRIDLDVEDARVEPERGGGVDAGEHEASSVPRSAGSPMRTGSV
jgi:hypothetical protein